MLKRMTGDIFTSKAESYVNPVNCVGVMGKGLALEFKRRFPSYASAYCELCEEGLTSPGIVHVHGHSNSPDFIISFPTKRHWREVSRISYIDDGLEDLRCNLEDFKINSVAMPMLGCGLGGLDEKDVLPLIERFSDKLPHVEVELWVKE